MLDFSGKEGGRPGPDDPIVRYELNVFCSTCGDYRNHDKHQASSPGHQLRNLTLIQCEAAIIDNLSRYG